jgi:4-hydroxybenzoate polyprenyltransferase
MTLTGLWRILRLPLFITAVADILAGYLLGLAPQWRAFDWQTGVLLAGVATGLYLFGMIQNDLVDIRRDRRLNVPRPLVIGEMSLSSAFVLLILTAGLAAFCAFELKGAALLCAIGAFGAINLYNLGAKHGPAYVAMTVMGVCRVMNFLVGVMAATGHPQGLNTGLGLLLPSGPLWAKEAAALFFVTAVVTGYSIMARRRMTVSTRPWQFVFVVTAISGFLMVAAWTMMPRIFSELMLPPVLRVLAVLALAALWPGGLWSAAGPERQPAEYGKFIGRALYWYIVLDAAFVADSWLWYKWLASITSGHAGLH